MHELPVAFFAPLRPLYEISLKDAQSTRQMSQIHLALAPWSVSSPTVSFVMKTIIATMPQIAGCVLCPFA